MENKFKIGDKVTVKEEKACSACRGKILEIVVIDKGGSYPIKTITEGGDNEIFEKGALELYSAKSRLQNRKIYVGNERMVEKVLEKLLELGCEDYHFRPGHATEIYVGELLEISYTDNFDYFTKDYTCEELTLTELFAMQPDEGVEPQKRTITVDGKDIEISEESFQAFKEQFNEED